MPAKRRTRAETQRAYRIRKARDEIPVCVVVSEARRMALHRAFYLRPEHWTDKEMIADAIERALDSLAREIAKQRS